MGGNPTGDRSTAAGLVTLCVQRHRDGAVSWHHGTLRARPLTDKDANGPLAWDIDPAKVWPNATGPWFEIAREIAVGLVAWADLTPPQRIALERLAQMEV